MHTARTSLSAALLIAASMGAALADPYAYTTITVPSAVPVLSTQIRGINDAGQIVGTYLQAGAADSGFIDNLASGAVTTFSGAANFGTDGNGINNKGQVVGFGYASGGPIGYLRDAVSGGYTILPIAGSFGFGINTNGVNDAGQVVGYGGFGSHGAPPGSMSFLFNSTTGTKTFFSDPATVGSYIDSGGFVVTVPGYTNAYDINNRGQVVGSISTIGVTQTGFLLDLATNNYTVLDVPGSSSTSAYGINDRGQVVGSYLSGSVTSGFLLDLSTGIYTTLTDPGATSTIAYGINNAGLIVGAFLDGSGNQNGFVATPSSVVAVPEPASLALLGGGIGVLAWVRRGGVAAGLTARA